MSKPKFLILKSNFNLVLGSILSYNKLLFTLFNELLIKWNGCHRNDLNSNAVKMFARRNVSYSSVRDDKCYSVNNGKEEMEIIEFLINPCFIKAELVREVRTAAGLIRDNLLPFTLALPSIVSFQLGTYLDLKSEIILEYNVAWPFN